MEVIPLLLMSLKNKLAQQLRGPSPGEEEVESPSEQSMAGGLPLQIRLPLEATVTSSELA